MERKEFRNRSNQPETVAHPRTFVTSDHLPEGSVHQKTDPRPPDSLNAIRYHRADQTGGLDNFSANIPFGLDAIAAFERAMRKKVLEVGDIKVPIRACALIVGGTRDYRSRAGGIHNGEVIAEWSIVGGLVARPNWKERVRGLPRPAVVVSPRG